MLCYGRRTSLVVALPLVTRGEAATCTADCALCSAAAPATSKGGDLLSLRRLRTNVWTPELAARRHTAARPGWNDALLTPTGAALCLPE